MGGPLLKPWIGRRSALLLQALAFVIFAFAASSAEARDFNCDASALRLTLGGSQTIEPITANRGASSCTTVKSQTSLQTGVVDGGALIAETTVPAVNSAQARGGLASLSVSAGALSGIPTPTLDAINAKRNVTVPIPAADQLLGLPKSVDIDLGPALTAFVAGSQNVPLLEVNGSMATAKASCVNSTPHLSGQTSVLGITVLGQTLPTDQVVQQALALFNGQTIAASQLDPSKIVLPAGLSFATPVVGDILKADVLGAIPPITLPASLLDVSITPSSQQVVDGGLTQRGLQVSLGIAGQSVLDAVIGEARVSTDSITCSAQAVANEQVNNAALSCGTRRLALLNVLDRGNYVALYGAADRRLAGKHVTIRSLADGRIVARPRVASTGLFHARAPLPPQRWRYTNRARYVAVYGQDRSLNLKLHRRMVFTSVRKAGGKVILSGVVTKPWANPRSPIVIRQRVTCRKQIVVARVRPDSHGRFRVTLKAPKNNDVGVYRATTLVGYPDGPDFRTYTLPGLVSFAR
jgi:hypothetical protein